MKTRLHVYPWGDSWAVEELTTWQALLNDLKLFGWCVALYNLWYVLFKLKPAPRAGKIIPFRRPR